MHTIQIIFNSVREAYAVLRELVEMDAAFACGPLPDGKLAVSCSPSAYTLLHLPSEAPARPLCKYDAPAFEIACGLRLTFRDDSLWSMASLLVDSRRGFVCRGEETLDVTPDSLEMLDGGIFSVRLLPGCEIHQPLAA